MGRRRELLEEARLLEREVERRELAREDLDDLQRRGGREEEGVDAVDDAVGPELWWGLAQARRDMQWHEDVQCRPR